MDGKEDMLCEWNESGRRKLEDRGTEMEGTLMNGKDLSQV
jgi:hypothetical protein